MNVKCVIHGSFNKYFELIEDTAIKFSKAGIDVIAPEISDKVGETNGFVQLASDKSKDPRIVQLLYLKKVSELGPYGFSYYVNPDGKLGNSASSELSVDLLTNTRYIFMSKLVDLPIYVPKNSVWKPEKLAKYISEKGHYPPPLISRNERKIFKMVQDLILPGSIIAVGGMIVDYSSKKYKSGQERDILLVRTHKWNDRFSLVGGRVKRNENLSNALEREIKEQTGLDSFVGDSVCTFDKIENSGYFIDNEHRVFADNIVNVRKRRIMLNDEAEDYIWIPPSIALEELDIEPNARKTLDLYVKMHKRIA